MSRSYRKNIIAGSHTDSESYKFRRKRRRRHGNKQELRMLIANQTSTTHRENGPIGWSERMGWTGSVDEQVVGDNRPYVDGWELPFEGHFLVNKDSLKKLDKEKRLNSLAESLHRKYDKYLKDKHKNHQSKSRKHRKRN